MTSVFECPSSDRLRALIEGVLSEPDQAAVVRHLDDCGVCQTTLERLAGGDGSFAVVARQLAEAGRSVSSDDRSIVSHLVAQFHERGADVTGEIPGDVEAGGELALDFLGPAPRPGLLGTVAQYEVIEVIGQGGMGIVLKAYDPALNRLVAVKVMAPQLAAVAAARRRFAREARAAAAVSHEHVVPIYAVDEFRGLPYLVMPFISGESLQDRLDRCGPLKLPEILRIGRQVAIGLAAAHDQGLIHRDIKPSNILLENGVERVKITDFGLARTVDDASLTHSDVVVGTPQYMAPEQARGEPVDPRSDLFSLGGVLYAMCLGRPPFRAPTALAVLKRVCEETPHPIRADAPEIPDWLVAIVETLLAKDPARRYGSAAVVAQLLEEHLARLQNPGLAGESGLATAPSRSRARSWRWATAAAVVVTGLVGLGWTRATEVTKLAEAVATILRIHTPRGVLVLQVDDPAVKVRVDDQAEEIVLNGAGLHELRLRPGQHRVQALKEGKLVYEELLTITKGGRSVAKIGRETGGRSAATEPRLKAALKPATPKKARPGSATNLAALRKELDAVVGEYHHLMKGPLAKDADVFRKLEDRMIELRRRIRAAEARPQPTAPRPASPAPARSGRSSPGSGGSSIRKERPRTVEPSSDRTDPPEETAPF